LALANRTDDEILRTFQKERRWGKAISTRLPLSFNRARVLEAIALIVFASLVIAFVHSVVPYLAD
jgi:hypothetical protein